MWGVCVFLKNLTRKIKFFRKIKTIEKTKAVHLKSKKNLICSPIFLLIFLILFWSILHIFPQNMCFSYFLQKTILFGFFRISEKYEKCVFQYFLFDPPMKLICIRFLPHRYRSKALNESFRSVKIRFKTDKS